MTVWLSPCAVGEVSYRGVIMQLHPVFIPLLQVSPPSAAGDRTKIWGTIINDPIRGDRMLQSQQK